MKKIGIILIVLALLAALCGCSVIKDVIPADFLDNLPVDLGGYVDVTSYEEFTETYVYETEEEYTEAAATTCAPVETYAVETEAPEVNSGAIDSGIPILMRELGADGKIGENSSWYVSWYSLCLSEENTKKYPALAIALERINAATYYDNSVELESFAEYDVEFDVDLYSSGKYEVLRADENVVSMLQKIESYYGGVHGSHYMFGYNIDTKTGKDISITDVVVSLDMLYVVLSDYLNANCAEELYGEVSANSLYNQYGEYPSWVIDGEKLTVWFNEYEIAPYAAGTIKVEIPFAEHSYLFKDTYTK